MASFGELRAQFEGIFGERDGELLPGNVGVSHRIPDVCCGLMEAAQPALYDYFIQWDGRDDYFLDPDRRPVVPRKPRNVESWLIRVGMWEAAWALAQLHYDQFLRQEASAGGRQNKGHPLCALALAGQDIASASLTRHYALLSSAGDVYCDPKRTDLSLGGLGRTLAQRYESRTEHDRWRQQVRDRLCTFEPDEPVYLEAMLALRWFTGPRAGWIMDSARVRESAGRAFAEVLLESGCKDADGDDKGGTGSFAPRGTRLEAATALLLSATPGFEVHEARRTSDEQVDLVVRYAPEQLAPVGLDPGPGLVECKSSKDPVTAEELRNFGAKCAFHRVKFGILVSRARVTGASGKFEEPGTAELVRRRFQIDGPQVLTVDVGEMHGKWCDMRGLAEPLAEDLRELTFGPKG